MPSSQKQTQTVQENKPKKQVSALGRVVSTPAALSVQRAALGAPSDILNLQQNIGNRAVTRMLQRATDPAPAPASASEAAAGSPVSPEDQSKMDSLRQALVNALIALGHQVSTDNVDVKYPGPGLLHFSIRLGRAGDIQPATPALMKMVRAGATKLPGAFKLIIGAMQQLDNRVRITARVLQVETSEILKTGKGDVDTPDMAGMTKAATDALKPLAAFLMPLRKE